jgi:putative transposase
MRASRTVLWGQLRIKRSAIPELLSDLAVWPTVDPTGLSKDHKATLESRSEAIRLFVEDRGVSLAEIKRKTGVHREQLYRLLERCLRRDADGRIYGFRGAIPNKRLKAYTRQAKVKNGKPKSRGGAAGAFTALLERFPDIKRWLIRQVKLRLKPLGDEVREVKLTIRRLHKRFLEKCKDAGIQENEYPFNRDLLGYRSLQALVKIETIRRKSIDAEDDNNDNQPGVASLPNSHARELFAMPTPLLPFDAIQFDGHKIDLRLTLKEVDSFGMECVAELTRIFILVCLDVVTRAVLGYQIVLATEYDSDEVARGLQSCFGASNVPDFTIPGLSIRSGGGYPCDIFEQAKYPGWRWFQFDSAKANIAEANLIRLSEIVGCYIHTGRLGEPDDRAFIERFFANLARLGFHQVPGSTGSSVNDGVRNLADIGDNITQLMTVDELEQVVYVMLADYNGESHAGLGGRTPLEAMRYWLNKPGVLIRSLPAQKRKNLIFLQEARIVTIVAGRKDHPRPHINFEGVRYTSDLLVAKPELVGKKLRIYFNIQDIRQLHAFFEDGAELGSLIAPRSWRKTAHSLRLRRDILRLTRLGKLHYRDGEDAIEVWSIYKRRAVGKDKRSANALAKQKQIQGFASRGGLPNTSGSQTGKKNNKPQSNEPRSADSCTERNAESKNAISGDGKQQHSPKAKSLTVRRTIVFRGGR